MKRRELMKYTLAAAAPVAWLGRAAGANSASGAGTVNEADAAPDAHLTAPLAVPASGEIRAAFLLAADAEVIDYAGPWGVFEYVMVGEKHQHPFKLCTVAASRDPVKTSFGMTVVPDYTFDNLPTPDLVVVPAMDIDGLAPANYEWLRAIHKSTALTLSICTGAFVLATAGLLDGKRATTHHGAFGMFRMRYPKVNLVRGVRYTEDGTVATSGGLTSGIDLALRVVERYYGRAVAQQTALNLEYQGNGWMYPQSNAQFAKKPASTAVHPFCAVCEMPVDSKPPLTAQYAGKTYYLCSQSCRENFVLSPKVYIESV
jgi:putative intracellular protease/amidase/YHS domain-containing protein